MADNYQVKDGLGDVFAIRSRDISPGGDGSIQRSLIFATPYHLDYGVGGVYQHCAESGIMAPGLPANATIYSFQWSSSIFALINRVRISAWSSIAFTTGIVSFNMCIARNFTSGDSGGTRANLSSGGGRLRTSMTASQAIVNYATTGGLTPGTRNLDPDPLNMVVSAAPITQNAPFFPSSVLTLFDKQHGGASHPLFFSTNDGFVIQASVPGTGSWQFAVTTEWDEVSQY